MNRLKKIAFGKTLYHGTSFENFKKIVSEGMILPQESTGAGLGTAYDPDYDGENAKRLESNFYGFVFLATTKYIATGYSIEEFENSGDYYTTGVVLEFDISEDALLPDDNDSPNSRTWQESAKDIQQVKVSGALSLEYLKRLYFIDAMGQTVFTANLNDWEAKYEKHKHLFEEAQPRTEQYLPEADDGITQFLSSVKSAGYTFDESYVILNQEPQKYMGLIKHYYTMDPNIPNDVLIQIDKNGDVTMPIAGATNLQEDKNKINFNYEIGWSPKDTLTSHEGRLENIYYDFYSRNPNVFDNAKSLLSGFLLVIEDITFTFDELVQYMKEEYESNQEDTKTANKINRLKKSN